MGLFNWLFGDEEVKELLERVEKLKENREKRITPFDCFREYAKKYGADMACMLVGFTNTIEVGDELSIRWKGEEDNTGRVITISYYADDKNPFTFIGLKKDCPPFKERIVNGFIKN